MNYNDFLRAKIAETPVQGFEVDPGDINPGLKPFNREIVRWLLRGGRRALFARFGLHKTVTQLETVRLAAEHVNSAGIITMPLGVRVEFIRDSAQRLGWKKPPRFIRSASEADSTGVYLTNYETVRDGKIEIAQFGASSLDEAAVLRGFGGTKTFRELMAQFAGDRKTMDTRDRTQGIQFRFLATAVPAPNEYIELLAYAAYLGVMDVGQAKTRFFKRDSTKADVLTLHPHKEREFWLWVASWALFITKPSDLGPEFSDVGYDLPPMDVRWHEVASDHSNAGEDRDGQGRMFKNAALGVVDASREKRDSLDARIAKLMELRAEGPDEHRILWHDLEAERAAIEAAIPTAVSVYGSQDLEEREQAIIDFSDGKFQELAAKPVIAGSGCNFQRHCSWEIFAGIGFKFHDFIQAIHRVLRFGQEHPVRIDIIHTEAEREVRRELERRWKQYDVQVAQMTAIVREFGLSHAGAAEEMRRGIGVERREASGPGYHLVNNDSVLEVATMDENSVGLILTSVPFSTQYEYSPNFADFGHNDNNAAFFKQMDFLTPELLRVLQPGRIAAIHVKDRIVPGGMTGLGYQTVYPFHAKCIDHFTRHGFGYLGMKTITTDVVRENNQTYRLGWTEQCKDGSKMGVGMPEYLLLFRKTPSDTANSYADVPVVKNKEVYTRARWQFDAHGFMRSSGDRLLTPEELAKLPHDVIYKWFREYSRRNVYDHEAIIAYAEALDAKGILPSKFMLLQPTSHQDDVWDDITRMLTLNGSQYAAGREMHLCPLQFDIADRVILQMSNPGDVVLDPFHGIGTVPLRAMKHKRFGKGCELSAPYWEDSVTYCETEARGIVTPSLFDVDDLKEAA